MPVWENNTIYDLENQNTFSVRTNAYCLKSTFVKGHSFIRSQIKPFLRLLLGAESIVGSNTKILPPWSFQSSE